MTRKLLAVVLPLVAIGLAIARSELFYRRTQDWVFRVAGYDPRDLLRGHYVQFRIEVDAGEPIEPCDPTSGPCCYCLERRVDAPAAVRLATCATAMTDCRARVRVDVLTGLTRWYVPEAGAAELDRALREAAADDRAEAIVAVDPDGQARVRTLRVR